MVDKAINSFDESSIINQFQAVRALTEALCDPLELEDYNLQAIAETSPVKWHLAHTTWFFETFILKRFAKNFSPYNEQYEYLFNSYYNGIGEQFSRARRSLLSRPSVSEIVEYRAIITRNICELIPNLSSEQLSEALELIVLGINHEQQHQELLLTDVKFNLFQNPLLPAYRENTQSQVNDAQSPLTWVQFSPELVRIGQDIEAGTTSFEFIYDNESPEHQYYLEAFEIANRLITNGEFLEFIEDEGYEKAELWLSDGWDKAKEQGWTAPLYWFKQNEQWYQYSLNGTKPLDSAEPVAHVSFYEADAFARWKGARLVTEQEWEYVAKQQLLKSQLLKEQGPKQKVAEQKSLEGNFLDSGLLQPTSPKDSASVTQLYGDVWEWTSSSYSAYPGFKPLKGAVGEYNGKFMANQFVLRGGSCVTSKNHMRPTYRNFFYPEARWQFSGIRLARHV